MGGWSWGKGWDGIGAIDVYLRHMEKAWEVYFRLW